MIIYECMAILMGLRDVFPLDKIYGLMPFSRRMEAPGQLLGTLNLGLRALLTWLRNVFPLWSDVSAEPF